MKSNVITKSKILDATICQITNLLGDVIGIYDVGFTKESVGFHAHIEDVANEDFKNLDGTNMFNFDEVGYIFFELFDKVEEHKFQWFKDRYAFHAYEGMVHQYEALINKMPIMSKNDLNTTRKLVIKFEDWHCFQHIGFMVRDKALILNIHMRSCDAFKHLYKDLFLAYYMGVGMMIKMPKEITQINMNISIDSLHIYKDEINQCREGMEYYVNQIS